MEDECRRGRERNWSWNTEKPQGDSFSGLSNCSIFTTPEQDDPISEEDFIAKWKASVGDSFEFAISITLLLVSFVRPP